MMKRIFPTVLVVTFAYVISGCHKHHDSPPPAGSEFTAKMGGVRAWHGVQSYSGHSTVTGADTAYNLPVYDTFAIAINSATSISLMGNTITFSSFDSTAKTVTYGKFDPLQAHTAGVVFYYLKDSIYYGDHQTGNASSVTYTDISTP